MTLAHSVTPLIQSLKGSYNYTGHVNMHGGCFKWVLKINFQGGVKKIHFSELILSTDGEGYTS